MAHPDKGMELEHLLWVRIPDSLGFCEEDKKNMKRLFYQTATFFRALKDSNPDSFERLVKTLKEKGGISD